MQKKKGSMQKQEKKLWGKRRTDAPGTMKKNDECIESWERRGRSRTGHNESYKKETCSVEERGRESGKRLKRQKDLKAISAIFWEGSKSDACLQRSQCTKQMALAEASTSTTAKCPECEWWPMTLMTLMTYDDIAAYWESNCLSTDNPHWVRMAKKHGTACTNFPAVAESRNSTDHTETFTIWPLWHSLTRWKAIAEKLYWWSLPAWSWKIFKSDLVFCAVNALQYTKDYVSCGLSH